MTQDADRTRAWLPLFLLLGTLALTAAAVVGVARAQASREQAEFEVEVEEAVHLLTGRLETYVALLRGATGLVAAMSDPDREALDRYFSRVDVRDHYPGIQAIGLSLRIPDGDPEPFTESWRARGIPDFHVWPPGPRPELHAIVYLYPMDVRNDAAIGYDMSSEPRRWAAMARARDQAGAAASAQVTLVQEIFEEKQPGFLIYLPVYDTGPPPPTVEERREALVGFAYSPYRAGDLLTPTFATHDAPLAVAVWDGDSPTRDDLLYASDAWTAVAGVDSLPSLRRRIDVYGRPWTLEFRDTQPLDGGVELAPVVGLTGLLCALALYAATRSQARARAAAERSAAELRVSEGRLRSAKEAAEGANRVKDEFLATVSHELRTPLNAMLGWTQMLRTGRLAPSETQQALETIERNAKAQAQLVEDLLDVSRILSGKTRLDVRKVVLPAVIAAALDTVRPAAAAKEIALRAEIEEGVEPIDGDPTRLQQVVWNLLSNAIKFTPPGGSVDVGLRQRDEGVEISVRDTGLGIAQEFLPYVFERFRQADPTSTRAHGGLGLGLGIVRHLVELHGGAVHAESDGVGRGATFVVTLPTRHHFAATPARGLLRPIDGETPAIDGLSGVDVLVVDDEPDSRELLARVLSAAGARVRVAGSAAEAERRFDESAPGVLVSDIAMPGEDGWSLLRRLRSRPAARGGSVPALALTAYARSEDEQRSEEAGFDAHLTKPVEPGRLTACVARLSRTAR